jgi:hypothetical protein
MSTKQNKIKTEFQNLGELETSGLHLRRIVPMQVRLLDLAESRVRNLHEILSGFVRQHQGGGPQAGSQR